MDLEILHGIAKNLPLENTRSYDALYTANEMINIIQKGELWVNYQLIEFLKVRNLIMF